MNLEEQKAMLAGLPNHEYRIYHHNTFSRVVATTMGYAATPYQAIEAAMAYAVNWNFNETRENMIVTFLECEGVEVSVK
jgi:6-phosphofructokinase